jgi:hypothetical protein
MGAHIMDITDNLEKLRYGKDGAYIEGNLPRSGESVKTAIATKEFCRIKGFIYVKKVPGNWHISFHAYRDLLYGLNAEELKSLKFSHTVNHMSFGHHVNNEYISENFGIGAHTNFAPYDEL